MSPLVLVLVILLILAVGPWYPYSRSWGYGPSGLLGIVLIFLLVLLLLGRL